MKKQLIIINCRFLSQTISGVQRFAIEMCLELKKKNLNIIFVSPRNIIHHDLAEQLDVKSIGKLKGHFWEQVTLRDYVTKNDGLLLSFCNTGPLFLKNQIITIHDLCFMTHPHWFSKSFTIVYNFLIPKIVKKSKHIITVSETSKNEISEKLKINPEKISVIYNA
uniref:glycosyltransferase n=1 Tax=Flavobacterium sp. TaxID=239 RepID=UPI0040497599